MYINIYISLFICFCTSICNFWKLKKIYSYLFCMCCILDDDGTDDGTDGRTEDDDNGTRRDTTGHDGSDGEGIQYLAKSILMVYPWKQTRTDISGLANKTVNRCTSFCQIIWFLFILYLLYILYIYIYIWLYMYCYVYNISFNIYMF